jgi:protein involved in polysaccharide export with SLBB domain
MSGLLISASAMAAMALPANPTGVTVHGAVNGPGFVALEGARSLNSTVAQLGGFSANADRSSVLIRRSNGELVSVNLGKLGTVPSVSPGDVVFVKAADPSTHVFLEGGMSRTGAVPFRQGMTLQEVLQGKQTNDSHPPTGAWRPDRHTNP